MVAKMSVTLVDDYGRTTKRVYGMEAQTLLTDYQTAAAAFITALTAVTDLGCVRGTLLIPVTDPVFAVTTGANVDVGGTASGWINEGTGKKASMKIPGVKAALVGADGSIAITGVIATFLAEFEDTGDYNLSDGEQIDAWIRAALDR